jgi:hypothetical protein
MPQLTVTRNNVLRLTVLAAVVVVIALVLRLALSPLPGRYNIWVAGVGSVGCGMDVHVHTHLITFKRCKNGALEMMRGSGHYWLTQLVPAPAPSSSTSPSKQSNALPPGVILDPGQSNVPPPANALPPGFIPDPPGFTPDPQQPSPHAATQGSPTPSDQGPGNTPQIPGWTREVPPSATQDSPQIPGWTREVPPSATQDSPASPDQEPGNTPQIPGWTREVPPPAQIPQPSPHAAPQPAVPWYERAWATVEQDISAGAHDIAALDANVAPGIVTKPTSPTQVLHQGPILQGVAARLLGPETGLGIDPFVPWLGSGGIPTRVVRTAIQDVEGLTTPLNIALAALVWIGYSCAQQKF